GGESYATEKASLLESGDHTGLITVPLCRIRRPTPVWASMIQRSLMPLSISKIGVAIRLPSGESLPALTFTLAGPTVRTTSPRRVTHASCERLTYRKYARVPLFDTEKSAPPVGRNE